MGFDVQKVRSNLQQLTAQAWSAIDELDLVHTHASDEAPEAIGPLKAEIEERLTFTLKSMVAAVRFAMEHLRAKPLSKELAAEIRDLGTSLIAVVPNWVDDGYTCKAIQIVWRYANAVFAGFECDFAEAFERERLARFMRNTAHILERDGQPPENESDVKRHLLKYLGAMFDDAINEPSVAKAGITFRADTGIRSIKSAIEYKYVANQNGLVAVRDGILADVKNYENHEVWKHFFAVIYLTGAYLSEEARAEWEAQLPENWKLITVVGKNSTKKTKGKKKAVQVSQSPTLANNNLSEPVAQPSANN